MLSADFMTSSGFHGEIQWISCNLVDFMKSGRFHAWCRFHGEIWWISCMKSGGFHGKSKFQNVKV